MIIDTHCHLDFSEFNSDRDAVLERANQAGVKYIINVGSSLEGSRRSVELAKEYDAVFASVGIHPHHAGEVDKKTLDEIGTLVKNKKVVAVGEIGLDYYRNLSGKDEQKALFRNFLDIAKDNKLPVIIHSRNAHRETLDMLKEAYINNIKGVMHCFSGDEACLKECLDLGLFVSFTCNLTFKNAKGLREVAKKTPLDRLLLETDAPFLAPQEFRGKRNEPAYLPHLVYEWSDLLNVSEDEIERETTKNAKNLFKIYK